MDQLSKASDCLSPLSRLFVTVATYVPALLLFHPSIQEGLVLLATDILLLHLVIFPLERKIFCKIYPQCQSFFHLVESEVIEKLDLDGQIQLILALMRFPRQRATFLCLVTLIKNIPLMLIIVFHWRHETPNAVQFSMILALTLISNAYFYSALYYELHTFLSSLLEKLHLKYDFTKAFQNVHFRYSKKELGIHDLATLLFIIFFVMVLQWTVVTSNDQRSTLNLGIQLLSIASAGVSLFVHIWYLSRRFFLGGLEKLFQQMAVLDYRQASTCLPLHTSSLLAQFDKTFNFLVTRLKASEQELMTFLFQETEKSRYRVLGEISALIAHDLNGPLHAAQYCVDQLGKLEFSPDSPKPRNKYYDHLSHSIKRATELTDSLRARLKNSRNTLETSSLHQAHLEVMRLLEMTYSTRGYNNIFFSFDAQLKILILKLSRVDLIQILDNLYRNCIENLLTHPIPNPFLRVYLHSHTKDGVEIGISDNGTGMSLEQFESLTSFQFTQPISPVKSSTGLGLRLTRKLIESHNGSLTVDEKKVLNLSENYGTLFLLKLKSMPRLIQTEGASL
ncbi:MAG: HAMP domain-containing sensor histidine kinase, partial [Bdellovibrionia bacterium]